MSTAYEGASRFCTISGPPIEYLVRVEDPTPEIPVRSIDTTRLGEPKSGSGASRVATFAVPENDTLSGEPLTIPLTETRLVFQGCITGDGASMDDVSDVEVDAVAVASTCAGVGPPKAPRLPKPRPSQGRCPSTTLDELS